MQALTITRSIQLIYSNFRFVWIPSLDSPFPATLSFFLINEKRSLTIAQSARFRIKRSNWKRRATRFNFHTSISPVNPTGTSRLCPAFFWLLGQQRKRHNSFEFKAKENLPLADPFVSSVSNEPKQPRWAEPPTGVRNWLPPNGRKHTHMCSVVYTYLNIRRYAARGFWLTHTC